MIIRLINGDKQANEFIPEEERNELTDIYRKVCRYKSYNI